MQSPPSETALLYRARALDSLLHGISTTSSRTPSTCSLVLAKALSALDAPSLLRFYDALIAEIRLVAGPPLGVEPPHGKPHPLGTAEDCRATVSRAGCPCDFCNAERSSV